MVHQLVAAAFIGPRPDGQEVLHANGVGDDNRLVNLRYGSHSENMIDRTAHGACVNRQKSHCPQGHAYTADNLHASSLRRGRRACLICRRAQDRASQSRRRRLKVDSSAGMVCDK